MEYCKSEKKCQIPGDLKILYCFKMSHIPLLNASKWHVACKMSQHFLALHYEGQTGGLALGRMRGLVVATIMLTEPGKDP